MGKPSNGFGFPLPALCSIRIVPGQQSANKEPHNPIDDTGKMGISFGFHPSQCKYSGNEFGKFIYWRYHCKVAGL